MAVETLQERFPETVAGTVIETSTLLATFRDPSGSVQIRGTEVVRHVYPSAASTMLELLDLPLTHDLLSEGSLVATSADPREDPTQPLLLHHQRVSFISYPWEWPAALWVSAAELTLDVCERLLQQGWILKDATPRNILFRGPQPVFVDLLSMQRVDTSKPIWFAYAQFVRTFLLPLLAGSRLGWPLQATINASDGYDPEDVLAAIPWYNRLFQPVLSLLTLPALLSGIETKSLAGSRPLRSLAIDPDLSIQVITRSIHTLRRRLRQVAPASSRRSAWSDYASTAAHYSDEDQLQKRIFVERALADSTPRHVLDAGCNTGAYSALAADFGAEVVAIDSDLGALEGLASMAASSGRSILPLRVDLAMPTPAGGWMNRETASFLDRCDGHFDTVMMLALVHHLLLTSQIPMGHIAALCQRLTTRNLIIEWVQPGDEMFKELVRGREEIYAGITEQAFREAFSRYFAVLSEETLGNGRSLYHMRRLG